MRCQSIQFGPSCAVTGFQIWARTTLGCKRNGGSNLKTVSVGEKDPRTKYSFVGRVPGDRNDALCRASLIVIDMSPGAW